MTKTHFQQEPVAIVGFACRLPGGNHTPQKLWDFLEDGGLAPNTVPKSRFNIDGHYDGSLKPGTMRPKGGMFLADDIDLAHFDAEFFGFSGADAIATDPNQRQMLEIVYEGLENAGITLGDVDGEPVACYVGSYATGERFHVISPMKILGTIFSSNQPRQTISTCRIAMRKIVRLTA